MTGGGRDELGRLLGLLLASCGKLGLLLRLLLASCGKLGRLLLRQLGGRQRHWLEAASTGNRSFRPNSNQMKDDIFKIWTYKTIRKDLCMYCIVNKLLLLYVSR
jgi:hypothetical protein